jgi:hypothetical protein
LGSGEHLSGSGEHHSGSGRHYASGERVLGQPAGIPSLDTDHPIDTDTTTGEYGSTGSGFGSDRQATGPAANTAGPHKSDMLNKADPRVDSDLDNSKTFGGNKTYQS